MFIIFFTIILILINVYFWINKKYLYIAVPCILFLPEYYGIEFTKSLPIFTVGRIILLLLFIYSFLNKKVDISFKYIPKNISKDKVFPISLLFMYFILRSISNLYYFASYGQAIKTLISLLIEQLLFIYSLYILSLNRKERLNLLKAIVYTGALFFVLGIVESFSKVRFFDLLSTVSRNMLNDHFIRLGLLRATTSFGLPNFYGNICLFLFPIILYLYNQFKEKKYLFIALLNLFAIVHSGCRSDLLFYPFILVIYFVFTVQGKKEKIQCFKNIAMLFVSACFIIILLSLSSKNLHYYYTGTIKSVLNEIGFDFDLNENAFDGINGFGENDNYGTGSRVAQFSGIEYTLATSPIFGLGSKAQTRGDVQYFSNGYWHPSYTYDVGYVEIFCDEGIIGFIGYLCLFASMFVSIHNNIEKSDAKYMYLLVATYLIGMLSTANMFSFLMIIVYLCTYNLLNHNE